MQIHILKKNSNNNLTSLAKLKKNQQGLEKTNTNFDKKLFNNKLLLNSAQRNSCSVVFKGESLLFKKEQGKDAAFYKLDKNNSLTFKTKINFNNGNKPSLKSCSLGQTSIFNMDNKIYIFDNENYKLFESSDGKNFKVAKLSVPNNLGNMQKTTPRLENLALKGLHIAKARDIYFVFGGFGILNTGEKIANPYIWYSYNHGKTWKRQHIIGKKLALQDKNYSMNKRYLVTDSQFVFIGLDGLVWNFAESWPNQRSQAEKDLIDASDVADVMYRSEPLFGIPIIDMDDVYTWSENTLRADCALGGLDAKDNWDILFPPENRNALYTYEGFLRSIAKYPSICGVKGDGIYGTGIDFTNEPLVNICKLTLSAIFAHFDQETQSLHYLEELNCGGGTCSSYNNTCTTYQANPGTGDAWPCADGATVGGGATVAYHGRGSKQLSYHSNYAQFGTATFLEHDFLLLDPDAVITDEYYAMGSGIFYYSQPESPKPSINDVMAGFWEPNEDDLALGRIYGGFPISTLHINGGLECLNQAKIDDGTAGDPWPQEDNRIAYFQEHLSFLNISYLDPGANKLNCRDMWHYAQPAEPVDPLSYGSGQISTRWGMTWEGTCGLIAWVEAPWTAAIPGMLDSCIATGKAENSYDYSNYRDKY